MNNRNNNHNRFLLNTTKYIEHVNDISTSILICMTNDNIFEVIIKPSIKYYIIFFFMRHVFNKQVIFICDILYINPDKLKQIIIYYNTFIFYHQIINILFNTD